MPHYYAIIAAAGISQRFGSDKPKQYALLQGKTILEHSIECLLSCDAIEKVVVALHAEDPYWPNLPISKHPKIFTVIGGETRTASVINALKALPENQPEDFVLIHDAARPFVPAQDILNLIAQTKDHEIGGILAAKVVDTIKLSHDGQHIEKTIPRENLYRALTPQCFRYGALLSALLQSPHATDDAMALELAGFQPLLVMGDSRNIKVTYQGDLHQSGSGTVCFKI